MKESMRQRLQTLARALTKRNDVMVLPGPPSTDFTRIFMEHKDKEILPGIECTRAEAWLATKAICAHEASHILFTCKKTWDDFNKWACDSYPLPRLAKHVLNCLEDGRAERAMGARYPQTQNLFTFSNNYFFQHKEWGTGLTAFLGGLISLSTVGDIPKGITEPEIIKLLAECHPIVVKAIQAQHTKDTAYAAKKILKILLPLAEKTREDIEKDLASAGTYDPAQAPPPTSKPRRPKRLEKQLKDIEEKEAREEQERKERMEEEARKREEAEPAESCEDEPSDEPSPEEESPENSCEETDKEPSLTDENPADEEDSLDAAPQEVEEEPPVDDIPADEEDSTDDAPQEAEGIPEADEDTAEPEEDPAGDTEADKEDDPDPKEESCKETDEEEIPTDGFEESACDEESYECDSEEDFLDEDFDGEASEEVPFNESTDSEATYDDLEDEGFGDVSDSLSSDGSMPDDSLDHETPSEAEESLAGTDEEASEEPDLSELVTEAAEELDMMDRRERELEKTVAEDAAPEVLCNDIDWDSIHRSMEFKVYRRNEKPSPSALIAQMKPLSKRLTAEIRPYFLPKQNFPQRHQKRGRIDGRNLWKTGLKEPNVFYKKAEPSNKFDVAAYLLIDGSGSMDSDNKVPMARSAAMLCHLTLKDLGVVHAATLFEASFYDPIVRHHELITFSESLSQPPSGIMLISAMQDNRDGYSIRIAAKELIMRPEKKKLLFVLSDGAPYHRLGGYIHSRGTADVRKAVVEAQRNGITVIGIHFGESPSSVHKMMFSNLVYSEINNLPAALGAVLKKSLKQ